MKAGPKVETGAVTSSDRIKEESSLNVTWKCLAPIVVAIAIALLPAPAGLPQYAWYYFALFAGVIVGLMLEPLPGGAIGAIGATLATLLAPWVLFSPTELARPGFNAPTAALNWACQDFRTPLSG